MVERKDVIIKCCLVSCDAERLITKKYASLNYFPEISQIDTIIEIRLNWPNKNVGLGKLERIIVETLMNKFGSEKFLLTLRRWNATENKSDSLADLFDAMMFTRDGMPQGRNGPKLVGADINARWVLGTSRKFSKFRHARVSGTQNSKKAKYIRQTLKACAFRILRSWELSKKVRSSDIFWTDLF